MQDNCLLHNSEISQTAKLYFRSKVNDSTIGDKAVVGDESRVTSSKLGEYVRIDRNNLIYHSEIGRYTYTGPFDMIFKVKIGSFSSISYGVTIAPPFMIIENCQHILFCMILLMMFFLKMKF